MRGIILCDGMDQRKNVDSKSKPLDWHFSLCCNCGYHLLIMLYICLLFLVQAVWLSLSTARPLGIIFGVRCTFYQTAKTTILWHTCSDSCFENLRIPPLNSTTESIMHNSPAPICTPSNALAILNGVRSSRRDRQTLHVLVQNLKKGRTIFAWLLVWQFPCIMQSWHFSSWGSSMTKGTFQNRKVALICECFSCYSANLKGK